MTPDWLDDLRDTLLPALQARGMAIDARIRLNLEAWLAAAEARGLLGGGAGAARIPGVRIFELPVSYRGRTYADSPDIDCVVRVTQVPGGEVVRVEIQACNGDASARESIEAAVYRASPLPQPPDAALFERIIEFRFHPTE